MKVVILAGGFGARISEESIFKPKPMIEIGNMPILWHIMKIYSYYGFNEFIICCGYKGYIIKEYFANYYLHHSDITFDFTKENRMIIHNNITEPWKITLVDTGLNTQTGGRVKRIEPYVKNETFMLTYGDGVANIDLKKLIYSHRKSKKFVTITGVAPIGRFGVIEIKNKNNINFVEKPLVQGNLINGGFMVMESDIFKYIKGDDSSLEKDVLEQIAKEKQLNVYKHKGFWYCMDTLRDKIYLENLIKEKKAAWMLWENKK